MKGKSMLALVIFSLLIVGLLALALADDSNSTTITNSTDSANSTVNQTTNLTDNSSIVKNWTGLCSQINERVADRIQAFDDGKIRRANSYNNTESMIQKLIDLLQAKGANTTQAEADNQILQDKIAQFDTDYSVFITKLISLKNFTCGNSSGAFASALHDAKDMLPTLRKDSQQVRIAALTVREDLVQARGLLVEEKLGNRLNNIENRTNNRTQNIENRINNRTANIENRVANITNRIENRINNTVRGPPPVK